nr:hypothetical protein [Bacteroidota bacterium]
MQRHSGHLALDGNDGARVTATGGTAPTTPTYGQMSNEASNNNVVAVERMKQPP